MGIKDKKIEAFKKLLYTTADIVAELYSDIETKKVYHSNSQKDIYDLFNEEIPKNSTDLEDLLSSVKKDVLENVASHYSPHFYAWVTSNATQASIIGDMIASALNVNATTWLNAASASEIEQRVIKWISEFIAYGKNANGVLLSGGSMANFMGLRIAISQKCPYDYKNQGVDMTKPLRFYISEQNHFCIDKAIISLGIGLRNLRKIKVNEDFTINIIDLEQQIKSDLVEGAIPLAVIGNAGTVNTGAVDSISELNEICTRYGLWLHLDAAYGGFAASTSLRNKEFEGLELADSIAVDLHKWLFVPFECGALLLKNSNHLKQTFSFVPEYQRFDHEDLKVDFSEFSMQQSRNFKALKVWLNFKAYGVNNLKESIMHSINLMKYLSELINSSDDFELVTPPSLSVVCFRYITPKKGLDNHTLNELNKGIVQSTELDGRVFIRETVLNEVIVLRACCTNFRREKRHVEFLIKVLRELGIKNDPQ